MQAEKLAVLYGASQVEIRSGTVESVDERGYSIVSDSGVHDATRAFSCIVEPLPADIVLFSTGACGRNHILSIVERPSSKDTSLGFPGDVTFSTGAGQINLNAGQDISISSGQKISIVSDEYSLFANKGLFSVNSLCMLGTSLVTKMRNMQTISRTVETVADHMLQKLKNAFREVEGADHSSSGDRLVTVKNLYSMRSRQAAILAKKDIKVDAERIHMG